MFSRTLIELLHRFAAEAGYITEVHHISGECKDGGAVYLEMQSIEHDPLEQANWTLLREIYTPESGYYYNYGGSCIEIRDNCTPQSARAFHKKYYHPRNACLVICGDLDRDEFLSVRNLHTKMK
jgi:Zn-dependent M16 (insulinase) family peptidase